MLHLKQSMKLKVERMWDCVMEETEAEVDLKSVSCLI